MNNFNNIININDLNNNYSVISTETTDLSYLIKSRSLNLLEVTY